MLLPMIVPIFAYIETTSRYLRIMPKCEDAP